MQKHSVVISGHKTSISLEKEFWEELKILAKHQHLTLNALMTKIDQEQKTHNLSSHLRLYVLENSKKS